MACNCSSTDLFNTGVPGCQPLPSVIKRIVLYPTTDSSGNINRIDLSSIPTDSEIIDLINEEDPRKRLFPVAKSMVAVTNVRSEPTTEDFDDGTVVKIRDGVKTFTGQFLKQGATLANELNKVECVGMSAFLVDGDGSLIGDKSTPGYLTPIPIKDGTWNVQTLDTTDTTIAKVTLSFQWADSVSDGDVGFLTDSDFEAAVNWLAYQGLIGIYGGTPTATSTSGFTIPVTNLYGSVTGQPVTGLVLADFDLNNVTTPAVITILTATESTATPGEYAFTFAAQTASDVVSLGIASTTKGFDDSGLTSVVITL